MGTIFQGSGVAATLGYRTESRWDTREEQSSRNGRAVIKTELGLGDPRHVASLKMGLIVVPLTFMEKMKCNFS
jgi:hypothetical protein